jgi:histidine ammonia-lyase
LIYAARQIVTKVLTAEKRESYFGINTGVGIFSHVKIDDNRMEEY